VGWVCGNEENGEIYGGPPHEVVCKKLADADLGDFRKDIAEEGSDTYCFFERYNCPRFTVKDKTATSLLTTGTTLFKSVKKMFCIKALDYDVTL
jgi:hypothetical protein